MTKDITKIDSLIDQLVSDFLTKRKMSSLNENDRLISEAVSIYEIGDDFIDSLKRDLSILLKNVPKVKKADQIDEYIKAVQRFKARLNLLANPYPNDAYYMDFGETPLYKLFRELKKEKEIERFADWYKDSLHNLTTELYISGNSEPRRIGGSYLELWWEKEKNKWKTRVQRKAKKFFEDFRNALRSFDIEGQRISVPEERTEEIHGHPVITIGYDPENRNHRENMEIVVYGIKQAKQAVAKRFPTLLPRSLPIVVNFNPSGPSGRYLRLFGGIKNPAIELSYYLQNPKLAAKVIVHEAAHDYWSRKLNESARQRWTKVYEANMTGRLDLKKLKKFWDKNRDKPNIIQLVDDTSLKTEDPQFFLQLSYLINNSKRTDFYIIKREDLERAIRNNEVWVVPKQPVTWYSGNNEEEMFTESVSMYVMYGEKAIPDFILANLKAIIGSPLK